MDITGFLLNRKCIYGFKRFTLFIAFIIVVTSLYSQPLYKETGEASFYAKKFDGRKTANGEKFSNGNFTCAHRTLKMGTMVRVTNLRNNKSVVVRINDRGPYVKGRIIDLTRLAADSLDFIHSGWTTVLVEELPVPVIDTVLASNLQKRNLDSSLYSFPAAWLGHWRGPMNQYTASGLTKTVDAELYILPTALPTRFVWSLVIDSQISNSELIVRDSSRLTFSLNEEKTEEGRTVLLGNHLIHHCVVSNIPRETEYTLKDRDQMDLEIRYPTGGDGSTASKTLSLTGNDNDGYQMQIAELQRIRE